MFVTEVNELVGPRWIINFPTKQHWKDLSQLVWIEQGLQDLRRFLIEYRVKPVAIPGLGTGNGGLDWAQVKPLIEQALGGLDTQIFVYQPVGQ